MDENTLQNRLATLFQIILVAGVVGALWDQAWFDAFIITGIFLITMLPTVFAKRFDVVIPAAFQLLTILFVFASLFLGEVHGYYLKIWWWDIALHTVSGFLLGIVGFLLVYVMNETERVSLYMKPGFIAFFAFLFAIGVGVFWEFFEYTADKVFNLAMQKPAFGDSTGLTDTMTDLMVDALGAMVISLMGYRYLKRHPKQGLVQRWVRQFIHNNPRLFKKTHPRN